MMRIVSIVKFVWSLFIFIYATCFMTLMILILPVMLNTPYTSSSNLDAVMNKLQENTNNLFHMKADTDKCQISMNLKLKVVKKKNCWEYQLTLYFLLSIILHPFVKKPVKCCMCLQE